MAAVESRTYNDPCGVARALDVIGQRWALLAVRELLLGPKRFGDLLRGLDGISPNVLSQRLKGLEVAEIVKRELLGPPVSAIVYSLTERGHALEPILIQLGGWGRQQPLRATGPMSADALLLALRTTFDPSKAGDLDFIVELRFDGDRVAVKVNHGQLTIFRGSAHKPIATVTGDVAGFRTMVYRGGTVRDAVKAGLVNVTGQVRAVQSLVDALR